MILISLAATVFTTRNVDIIKWDCSLKKDELSISWISSKLSHLMITTFLVVKTVAAREISIIKWNCRLMVCTFYIVTIVCSNTMEIIKWDLSNEHCVHRAICVSQKLCTQHRQPWKCDGPMPWDRTLNIHSAVKYVIPIILLRKPFGIIKWNPPVKVGLTNTQWDSQNNSSQNISPTTPCSKNFDRRTPLNDSDCLLESRNKLYSQGSVKSWFPQQWCKICG